jgi:hypothetical protein
MAPLIVMAPFIKGGWGGKEVDVKCVPEELPTPFGFHPADTLSTPSGEGGA